MDKYLNKRPRVSIGSSSANVEQEPQQLGNNVVVENNPDEIEIDKEKIKADPGLRDSMDSFDVNIRDRIPREYVAKVCGSSCKRADILRQNEYDRMVEMIEKGEISSVKVLETVFEDGVDPEISGKSKGLLQKMENFDFVFLMMLMKRLLVTVKEDLQAFRESGWDDFLQEVEAFCRANEIDVPIMDDIVPRRIRMKNDGKTIANYHYYRVEIFCQVVDLISQEMRNRFSESSTDLLECMVCLDPRNHFSNFNVDKLVHLSTLYPEDFSSMELSLLTQELRSFVSDARTDTRFSDVEDLGTLSQKMVEMMKDKIFKLVYRLIKLVLLLPVATTSVERVLSAMKFVKLELRNKMGDDWLNGSLMVYSENEVFATILNEMILSRFQKMGTRRSQLSRIA
ncbi:uncharacterized protein LOC121804615 [Salvia splendens]|uniref:uncharacterized protein LOC121804615 n=1 Tax=Salvia splendens TaxID=180675 RepID=UPI001C279B86|nr:uncharacterized protein LOC121804615 [Salvia splendens]